MNYAYMILLRLYPAWHRARFAGEMADVFDEARRDEREAGWLRYTWFLIQEFAGLLRGASSAWVAVGVRQPYVVRHGSLLVSLLGGVIVTIAVHGTMYRGIEWSIRASQNHGYPDADKFALLVIASLCCLLLAVLLVAARWTMERSMHARTARRHKNLYGYSRRAGRQLRGAPR